MATELLVLASSQMQYQFFISQYGLLRINCRYVIDDYDWTACAYGTTMIILEGYELNEYYTVGLMSRLSSRFNIYYLTEAERWLIS